MNHIEKSKQTLADHSAADISHKLAGINLLSSDPKRLAEFYGKYLGADIVNDPSRGGPNRVEIRFGSSDEGCICIAVNLHESICESGNRGILGFELRVADANAEYERLTAMGAELAKPPIDLPWGYRYFGITDPDGNEIDLVQEL